MLENFRERAFLEVQRGVDEIEEWLHVRKVEVTTLAQTSTVRSLNWSVAEPYLKEEVDRINEFFFFQLVTPDGSFANTKVGRSDRNIKDRDYFQKALAGQTNISDPFISRSTGIPLIAIATPIWSNSPTNRSPIGVFHGNVRVDHIADVVNSLRYGENSYAFALNSQGQAIVHPDSTLMSTVEKPALSLLESPDRNLEAIARRMVNQQQGIELMEIDGTRQYVAYVSLQEANWSVALVIPRQNIESQLQFLDLVALTVGGLTVTMITVLWRVQAFEQAQLKKSKALADAANHAKSEFLANMNHELRTPLNGILGYAQILQRDPATTEKQQKGLGIIYQCGFHLLTLINDILDLSKLEAQKMDLYPQDFHFANFLTTTVEICRVKAEQKGIAFHYQPDANLPTAVYADDKRLRQVLLNLLSNAVKFTDFGNVTFTVSILADSSEPSLQPPTSNLHRIRFQVEDTGIGISPDKLVAIFLPFEQAGKRDRNSEGTGLGLAISQQIVQIMGSSIQVESIQDKGSRFWFEVDLPTATDWLSHPATAYQKVIGYQGERRKILMIDDRMENRAVVMGMLTTLDFKLSEADNGQAGLDLALQIRPDLIITDVMMAKMDGLEMTRRLRQLPDFINKPIIASPASLSQVDIQEAMDAGCNSFFPKPIEFTGLLSELQRHLELQWIYETAPEEKVSSGGLTNATDWVVPSPEELTLLYQAAQDGFMADVQQEANRLKQLNPQYAPFVNKLLELSRNFDDEAILSLLAPHA